MAVVAQQRPQPPHALALHPEHMSTPDLKRLKQSLAAKKGAAPPPPINAPLDARQLAGVKAHSIKDLLEHPVEFVNAKNQQRDDDIPYRPINQKARRLFLPAVPRLPS
ncbi:hypothetical protein JCM8097_002223 [Rhodosporidiobolus ruineniae]